MGNGPAKTEAPAGAPAEPVRPRLATRVSVPLAGPFRRVAYKLAHAAYLMLPSALKDLIRRHRPRAWRQYVREHMIPAVHAHGTGQAPPRKKPELPPGLTLVGYLNYAMGLGEAARSLARACEAAGVRFNVRNLKLVQRHLHDEPLPGDADSPGLRDVALFCLAADAMPTLPPDLRAVALPGQYRIAQWYWELEKFPRAWWGAFNEIDELWAGSPFIRDCLAEVSPRPVLYMPPPIEVRLQGEYSRAGFDLPEGKFLLLFSFDFDSYAVRKNPRACIEAFRRAFPPERDDVALVIKTIHAQRYPEALAALRDDARADPRTHVLDLALSRDASLGLISVCDAYLSLHRSEGLGQGMGEAMCLGKPVVATGYSGNLAFMNADNSCLVGYRMVPVLEGEYPFGEGQFWAEPDLDDAARHMRRLAEDPALCARIGDNARRHMAAHFSAAACGARIRDRLEIIRGWRDGA